MSCKIDRPKVCYIGSGIGAISLLTMRALECLESAGLVVYEAGLDPRVLLAANSQADFIRLDAHEGADEVAAKISEKAKTDAVTVRISDGSGFNHLGLTQEMKALASKGVAIEIVPGIDNRLAGAALAGVPAYIGADRAFFIAANSTETTPSNGSIVLMEGIKLEEALAGCLDNGVNPQTPAVFISQPGTCGQKTTAATLSSIIDMVSTEMLKQDGLLIVGEQASTFMMMDWRTSLPLSGQRIIVTRARHQSQALVSRLEALGADTMAIPTIEMGLPEDVSVVEEAIARFRQQSGFEWIIFTSANGVEYFMDRLIREKVDIRALADSKIGVIGPATEKALNRYGIMPDIVPKDYVAEGLIEAMAKEDMRGKKVLIPRALEAREILPQTLMDRGAHVIVAPVYETRLPHRVPEGALEVLSSDTITMVTFTSSSTVTNWVALIDKLGLELTEVMQGARTACIGPVTAKTITENGMTVDIEAQTHTVDGLVEAILASI